MGTMSTYAHILGASFKNKITKTKVPSQENLPAVSMTIPGAETSEGVLSIDRLHAQCFRAIMKLFTDSKAGFSPAGTLHVEHSWELITQVPALSRLEIDAAIVKYVRTPEGTKIVVNASLATENGGEPCYREQNIYLDKSTKGEDAVVELGEDEDTEYVNLPRVANLRETYGETETGYLKLPENYALASRKFTLKDARAWAALTGDINPVHISKATAKLFGFKSPILHGVAGEVWAAKTLGLGGQHPASGQAYFRAPILLPAQVELRQVGPGAYAVVDPKNGRDFIHLTYSGEGIADKHGELECGLALPLAKGKPSSTAISRGVIQALAKNEDIDEAAREALGEALEGVKNWRKDYRGSYVALAKADNPARGTAVAEAGLAWLRDNICLKQGGKLADLKPAAFIPDGETVVQGTAEPEELRIPIKGVELGGVDLVNTLYRWQENHVIRPGVAEAIEELVYNPGMLRLRGRTVAVLGAGAELSPVPYLLRWGANVAAVARPTSARIQALAGTPEKWAGKLEISPANASDIAKNPAEIAAWIASREGRLAVADILYAPGADFILSEAGAAAVMSLVGQAREDASFAWYGTPSDAYSVAHIPTYRMGGNMSRRTVWLWKKMRTLRPARLPGLAEGEEVTNLLLEVQGPSYSIAKRIPRWVADIERAKGRDVSFNIAPLSITGSVLISKGLEAAYAGLKRLGYKPMPADTTAGIMAALMVWDMHHPEATRDCATFHTDRAVDSGLLGSAYELNDIVRLAVVLGAHKLI